MAQNKPPEFPVPPYWAFNKQYPRLDFLMDLSDKQIEAISHKHLDWIDKWIEYDAFGEPTEELVGIAPLRKRQMPFPSMPKRPPNQFIKE